jgi:hypothetical protein
MLSYLHELHKNCASLHRRTCGRVRHIYAITNKDSCYDPGALITSAPMILELFVRTEGHLKRGARYPISTQPIKLSRLVTPAYEKIGLEDDETLIRRWKNLFNSRMMYYVSDRSGMTYCIGYDTQKTQSVDLFRKIIEGFANDIGCPFHLVPPAMRGSTYVWIGNSIQRQYPYVRDMRGKMDGKYTDEWAE